MASFQMDRCFDCAFADMRAAWRIILIASEIDFNEPDKNVAPESFDLARCGSLIVSRFFTKLYQANLPGFTFLKGFKRHRQKTMPF